MTTTARGTEPAAAPARLTGRLVLGAVLAGAAAVPFLVLMLLVEGRWEWLENLDQGVARSLNAWALHHPTVVRVLLFLQDALNPNVFRAAAVVVAVALWRVRARRLAVWVVVTTVAGSVLGRRWRVVAWTVGAALVLLTGFDRIALGVHYVSDVLGGWVAAGAVLLGTTTAFDAWRGTKGRQDGLDPAGSRRLAETVDPSGR